MGGMALPVRNTRPPWPGWLVDRLGVDYFGSVVEVEVFEGGSDALLREIGGLGRLDTLIFGRSNVTPAGCPTPWAIPPRKALSRSYQRH